MAERVRVGVIGTSAFTELLHLHGLASHPQVELAALCGRNQERAQAVAQQHGFRRVYADYRRLLDDGDLDAVVVAAPDDLHYPMAMAALERGLHVLCEKPLALTAADAKAMYETAARRGVKHMTYFTYRWFPNYRHLHALLAQGYVGRPYALALQYWSSGSRRGRYSWRYDARRANGVLGDLGSHLIDLARWFAGDIAAVQAQLGTFAVRPDADGNGPLDTPANDEAQLLVHFANGARGTIHVTSVALVPEQQQRLAIYGDAGALETDPTSLAGTVWPLRGGRGAGEALAPLDLPDALFAGIDRSRPVLAQFGALFRSQAVGDRLFIDGILHDRPVEPSFYDGWQAQEVIAAALESGRSGRRVPLAPVAPITPVGPAVE